jgi:hypothetical protein
MLCVRTFGTASARMRDPRGAGTVGLSAAAAAFDRASQPLTAATALCRILGFGRRDLADRPKQSGGDGVQSRGDMLAACTVGNSVGRRADGVIEPVRGGEVRERVEPDARDLKPIADC